jgi:glucose/arabinose dehydrogenase
LQSPILVRHALFSLSLLALVTAIAGGCNVAEDPAEEGEGEEDYTMEGKCDGLPRITSLKTPPGVCVGLVAKGFTFARGMAELPSGDFVLAEMGGWAQDKGAVWLLRRLPNKRFSRTRIAKLIDKPSGVAVGPDGLPYIGTPKGIFRMDPYEQTADPVPRNGPFRDGPDYKQPRLKVVIGDLPGTGRHPLSKFVFDKRHPWTIHANVGSATDVCEQGPDARPPNGYPMPCKEADGDDPHGVIRTYVLREPDRVANGFKITARGLRNSMALAVHPTSNALIQAENSRDSIQKHAASLADTEVDLPHEELNVIVPGSHYGWPYCYDNGTPNPEYRGRVDCARFTNPAMLLPGHASPLGMTYYQGSMFPAPYRNNLLVTYHGYRANGHRLVVVPVDANGVPGTGEPLDIIRGWEKSQNGREPLGSPVDVTVAKDGSIYVTEDKNGDVLRLFYDPAAGNGAPMRPRPPANPVESPEVQARCAALATKNDPFSVVQREVIDTYCVSCHGVGPGFAGGLRLDKCNDVGNAKRLLKPRLGDRPPYVVPNRMDSELLLRLKGEGFPQMPAGGLSPEHLHTVESWIAGGAPVPQP